uniref:Plant natriuretic peptide-like 8 n=1 Tax=Venturia pyrina TaxID=415593 RepID=A0A513ZS90_9PEZI|nr:plant natriuretic peptide-like 8 [Venturia pyrina]
MKALTTLFAISYFAHLGLCDLGNAVTYPPLYLPNKCYGHSEADIPTTKLFAAVGRGLWNNGGVCGRYFEIRCVSPDHSASQCTGKNVIVKIIEGKVGYRALTFSLSQTAAAVIYPGPGHVKIEYHEVGGQGW